MIYLLPFALALSALAAAIFGGHQQAVTDSYGRAVLLDPTGRVLLEPLPLQGYTSLGDRSDTLDIRAQGYGGYAEITRSQRDGYIASGEVYTLRQGRFVPGSFIRLQEGDVLCFPGGLQLIFHYK